MLFLRKVQISFIKLNITSFGAALLFFTSSRDINKIQETINGGVTIPTFADDYFRLRSESEAKTTGAITLFFILGTVLLFFTFDHYMYLDQSGQGFLNLHNYH